MALWGNNDNVGSIGTVSLDYSNRVVSGWAGTATGLGVSFGETGYAQAGDKLVLVNMDRELIMVML